MTRPGGAGRLSAFPAVSSGGGMTGGGLVVGRLLYASTGKARSAFPTIA